MGFFAMVFSAVIGIFLIALGFSKIKSAKSQIGTVAVILIGVVFVSFAIWLGLPK